MMMTVMNDDVVSGDHIDLGVERIESAIFRSFSGRLILAHVRGRYQPEWKLYIPRYLGRKS